MNDVAFGLLALAVGALFCFRGYLAFRLMIPLWAAFVGFTFGAGIVAGAGGGQFLGSLGSWLVGFAVALIFAVVAYLVYEAAVVLAMGSIGFSLGASLMVALDVSWTWVIVLVGVLLGAILAVAAIVADLPMVLLMILSAFGGASAITTGIMLIGGALNTADLSHNSATRVADSGWWLALYLAVAVVGLAVQGRAADGWSQPMRSSWTARRGRAAQPSRQAV
jgi:hypothetical protein